MKDLRTELRVLQAELKTLVPQALDNLTRDGRITPEDPVDAVGICYSQVGNSRIYHDLSVRTSERCKVLTRDHPEFPETRWAPAEYEIWSDLAEFVQPSVSYTRICESLTAMIIDVVDARDLDEGNYSEFDQLQKAVREVAHWLTRNWQRGSVPAVEHPIFFAIDSTQEEAGDNVARSVHRADMELAGFSVPEVNCYECDYLFTAPLHIPGESFDCPSCGEVA